MPDTAHAKLGPSSAETWMNCPGSAVLSVGMERKGSVYADEGTQAHALAEQVLNGADILDLDAPVDMKRNVGIYVAHVNMQAQAPGAALHVEAKVKITDDLWGTADAVVWKPLTRTLHVIDLKYGAGVGVEVTENLQLKIYSLAALLEFGYPAEAVVISIVQPRYGHPDGPIRSKEYSAVDLLDFHADLLDAIARVDDAAEQVDKADGNFDGKKWSDKFLHPTAKGCKWCAAAPKCPKVKALAQETAKQVFAEGLAYDPKDLADTLDLIPILKAWIANVDSFAYAEAEAGRTPPRYKLVPKRATRRWKADINVFKLAEYLDAKIDEVKKPLEPLPVGDILKLCPGKNAAEREAYLADWTVKESSGHTLVPDSDKRDAVRVDAASAFAD